MKLFSKSLALVLASSFCLSTSSVMITGQAQAASKKFCNTYANKQAAKRTRGGRVVGSALAGAGLGALAGAIVGGSNSVARGAIIGGVGGAGVGAISVAERRRSLYKQYYNHCRHNM